MGCAAVATGGTTNRIQPKTAPTNQRAVLREQPGHTETERGHRIKNKLRLSWGSTQPTNKAIACDLENKLTARGDQKGSRKKIKGCRRLDTGLQFIDTFFNVISKTDTTTLPRTICGGTKRKNYEGGGNQPSKKEKLDATRLS